MFSAALKWPFNTISSVEDRNLSPDPAKHTFALLWRTKVHYMYMNIIHTTGSDRTNVKRYTAAFYRIR